MKFKKTKHTHIVQQKYLQNFSVSENNKNLIWRFDKSREKIQKIPISKCAVENYFYPQEIEDWLANEIELKGITLINIIIKKESVDFLDKTEKIDLIRWILVQDCRTREYRIEIKQGIEALTKRFLEIDFIPVTVPELLNKKYSIEYGEEPIRNLQMNMILRFEKLAPQLSNYHWYICVNDTKLPFYTSDHPIIKRNPYISSIQRITGKKAIGSGIGYLVEGIHLAVPISPRLLIEIGDLSPIMKEPAPQFLKNELTKSKRQFVKKNVEFYNGMVTGFSNQYIFSQTNDFTIIRDFLALNPEAKNKKRKRFKIM